MKSISDLKIKVFADGADKRTMLEMLQNPLIKGFTTNPTLMRKAGISDYATFARDVLTEIRHHPISFEVFADDFDEMERQAHQIASWGDNVFVKVPVTNTRGESALDLISRLTHRGIQLNVTALLPLDQVRDVCSALRKDVPAYISVFAGRIADTGRDPLPLMTAALEYLRDRELTELIWASPRELLNIFQADAIGCHVITVTGDILKKLSLVDKDLHEYSLETVSMFYEDARSSGFSLSTQTQLSSEERRENVGV
jgi:transaldolase